MKAFNLITLFVCIISTALAAKDYQITNYGCPRNCDSQKRSSCDIDTYPVKSNGVKYFCALSTHLPNYDDYCGKSLVLMLTDGTKNMINVKVVDSCSSCPKYHVDLSVTAFEALLPLRKGEADSIWAIYDSNGKKLTGPYYKSVSSAAKKFGMSEESFVSAFAQNGSKLAKSGSHVGSFSKDVSSVESTTTQKSVSIKIVTKVITKTPFNNTITTTALAPKQTTTTVVPNIISSTAAKTVPSQTVVNELPEKEIEEKDEDGKGNVDTSIGVIAIGGGILGAAGLGLLLMKKKSPGTYDGIKQKFPEAFSQLKRGVSRSATSIRRKVTTRRSDYV